MEGGNDDNRNADQKFEGKWTQGSQS
jgi:hypothetical protein